MREPGEGRGEEEEKRLEKKLKGKEGRNIR